MKLIDIREIWKDDLRDPEFQKGYLQAMYEEGGAEGILQGLEEIAIAEGKTTEIAPNAGTAHTALHRSPSKSGAATFETVQTALNAIGLDLAIVPQKV